MRAGGGLRQGPNPTSERKDSLRRYVSFRRARGARMARRHGTRETLQSARKHLIIKEIQAAVARELGARCEVPKTMPQRIADLLRELHRRLRNPSDEAAPRVGLTEPTTSDEGGVAPPGGRSGIDR
jgi:hypothetical protein